MADLNRMIRRILTSTKIILQLGGRSSGWGRSFDLMRFFAGFPALPKRHLGPVSLS